jgi:signal transduction histidine kinase
MSVAFLFPPEIAGVVAFLGSSDPRELKREVRPLRALFNRSQAALAVFAASLVFHAFSISPLEWAAILPAMLAVLVDYLVNSSLVSVAVSLTYRVPVREVLRRMRIGNPVEFIASYVGLGFLGVLLGRLFLEVGWWAVAAFVMPLLLARQMFFRTRALEDATKELKDREVILRALSNRMAEERYDERQQIAGYLHDDMAQLLFRMSLHIDIMGKQLAAGDGTSATAELEAIRKAKERTTEMLRSLIKDLRLSPLGRAGLHEAISSLSTQIQHEWNVPVRVNMDHVEMPPPVQLLCYQIVREAVTNAAKHAEASELSVKLEGTAEGVRVAVSDDGTGFDIDADSPEGHFGLTLMRERAQVAGGSLTITSSPEEGTTIIAEFPTSWLVEPVDAPGLDDGARPS